MKSNIGKLDKIVRILAAVTIAVLYITHQISGLAAIVLLLLAGVLILTSIIGFCPLYFPLGLSTKEKEQK